MELCTSGNTHVYCHAIGCGRSGRVASRALDITQAWRRGRRRGVFGVTTNQERPLRQTPLGRLGAAAGGGAPCGRARERARLPGTGDRGPPPTVAVRTGRRCVGRTP